MTRPAINISGTIFSPGSFWQSFDYKGAPFNNGTYTEAIRGTAMNKIASISTRPVDGPSPGTFHFITPTTYHSGGGNLHASSGGIYITVPGNAGVPNQPYYFRVAGSGATGSLVRDAGGIYPVPAWMIGQLERKALVKLRDQQVNIGVAIAEAGETADLFINTVNTIYGAVKAFESRRPRDFAKARRVQGTKNWKETPKAWLEVQYGWNPLMADVQGACTELDSKRDKKGVDDITCRAQFKRKETVDLGFISGFVSSFHQVGDVDAVLKIALTYRLRDFWSALLSSLGLANPAEILWERVPYSFVVDWFLPVGEWLSAFGADTGYDFISGYNQRFIRTHERSDGIVGAGNYQVSLLGDGITGDWWYFQRNTYGASPIPGLNFKTPVSPGHIANAMSLLSSAFGGSKPPRYVR